jgi:hypothetical protein
VRLATRLDNLLGTAVLVMHWEPILIYGGAIPLPRSNTTSNRCLSPEQVRNLTEAGVVGSKSVWSLHTGADKNRGVNDPLVFAKE